MTSPVCPECKGAGEIVDGLNAHDPNAKVFVCRYCEGAGEVECDGCDECDAEAYANTIEAAEGLYE